MIPRLLRLRQKAWRILAMTGISIFLLLLSGCIRLQGGAFYAKKNATGEPKVKEVYADTDKLLGQERESSGKIEVGEA